MNRDICTYIDHLHLLCIARFRAGYEVTVTLTAGEVDMRAEGVKHDSINVGDVLYGGDKLVPWSRVEAKKTSEDGLYTDYTLSVHQSETGKDEKVKVKPVRLINSYVISSLKYCSFVLSYMGLLHFFTTDGRLRWYRVFEKYYFFFLVSLGIWNDKAYDAYGLDRPEARLQDLTIDMAVDDEEESIKKSDVKDDVKNDENERRDKEEEASAEEIAEVKSVPKNSYDFRKLGLLMQATVAPRAVLMQIAPFLTPLSVYAIGGYYHSCHVSLIRDPDTGS